MRPLTAWERRKLTHEAKQTLARDLKTNPFLDVGRVAIRGLSSPDGTGQHGAIFFNGHFQTLYQDTDPNY